MLGVLLPRARLLERFLAPSALCPLVLLLRKPPEQAGHTQTALWKHSAQLRWSQAVLRRPVQRRDVPAGPPLPLSVLPSLAQTQPGMLKQDLGRGH